jgi:hypothetical protein
LVTVEAQAEIVIILVVNTDEVDALAVVVGKGGVVVCEAVTGQTVVYKSTTTVVT